jgi:hypothetical protein
VALGESQGEYPHVPAAMNGMIDMWLDVIFSSVSSLIVRVVVVLTHLRWSQEMRATTRRSVPSTARDFPVFHVRCNRAMKVYELPLLTVCRRRAAPLDAVARAT